MMPQKTREELMVQLHEELARPEKPEIITMDEYKYLFEVASFECMRNRDPRFCDGRSCPPKPDDIRDDYYDECVDARSARLKLDKSHLTLTPAEELERHQHTQTQQAPDDADQCLVARKYGGTVVWR